MSSLDPMEHLELPASQELPVSNLTMNLSPPRTSSKRGIKERRDPSVTPRKFNKFFNPRSYGTFPKTRARKALNDITAPALNRNTQSSPIRPLPNLNGQESIGFTPQSKRRKVYHTPETSSEKEYDFDGAHNGFSAMGDIMSSPCERAAKDVEYIEEEDEEGYSEEDEELTRPEPLKRIVKLQDRGLGGQLLNRSLGTSLRQRYEYPVNDWQDHTAGFYSKPEDVHMSMSLQQSRDGHRTIPFCARGLNREGSTLVALGDEEGYVRIMETEKGGTPSFSKYCWYDRIHSNAIIDMAFSADDNRLATASGDQSARVFDMQSNTTIAILGSHTASLKQVKWQPGSSNNNILATSSRDGSIQLWDLRCNANDGPTYHVYAPLVSDQASRPDTPKILYNRPIISIYDGHKPRVKLPPALGGFDQIIRPGENMPRSGDVSVTAIHFLPAGREHLLLSGSEADASVKLWDIRQNSFKYRPRGPLSSTSQPRSHNKFRHFGITSLNMSGDGSRFYTLCKDNTVYAYSTAHLMLGHAPELSTTTPVRPPTQTLNREGLGPLYCFRHPKLLATTFYVKSDIRPAKNGKCEMLAVGSTDGFVILFPTDERYLPSQNQLPTPTASPTPPEVTPAIPSSRPALRRVSSGPGSRVGDSLLVSMNGTALERGHGNEVGSLTWTSSGDLVTVGDDFLVRCWREDRDEARDLRVGGEKDGRRWACGWADVKAGYDEEDDQEL